MQKSLHGKKIFRLAACAAVIFSLAACDVMSGVLSELGASQETAGAAANSVPAAADTTEAANTNASENAQTTAAEPTDEAGGNPADGGAFTIEITILEDKYICDNREISYDELLEIFDTLTEADVVQFRDENAALDTDRQAAAALDDRGISYINANQ